MKIPPSFSRALRFAAIALLPFLREAALAAVERWARRARERYSEDDGWRAVRGASGHLLPWDAPASESVPEDEEESAAIPGFLDRTAPGEGCERLSPLESDPGTRPRSGNFAEQTADPDNLLRAWRRMRRRARTSPGDDGQTVAAFADAAGPELASLGEELAVCRYRPRPLRCFRKRKGGGKFREIGIPAVRDRVAQTAMLQVLDRAVGNSLSPWSFAYRDGRGCHEALDEADRLIAEGRRWIVRADVAECFDRIPHGPLLDELARRFDPTAAALIGAVVTGPRRLGRRLVFPRRGVPQGSPLSPMLANLALDPVDRAMRDAGHACLRYADDLLVACATRPEAVSALGLLDELLAAAGLSLNREKSRVVSIDGPEGFDFLGHVYRDGAWAPLPERIERLRARVATHLRDAGAGGRRAAACVKGWLAYYRGVDPQRLTGRLPTNENKTD